MRFRDIRDVGRCFPKKKLELKISLHWLLLKRMANNIWGSGQLLLEQPICKSFTVSASIGSYIRQNFDRANSRVFLLDSRWISPILENTQYTVPPPPPDPFIYYATNTMVIKNYFSIFYMEEMKLILCLC